MDKAEVQISTLLGSASDTKHIGVQRDEAQGAAIEAHDVVQCEDLLSIFVDGVAVCTLACSADHPLELVAGHLTTEGSIAALDDIEDAFFDAADSCSKPFVHASRCSRANPSRRIAPSNWRARRGLCCFARRGRNRSSS